MEKIYNKLVRDKIPEIIKANGENPKSRVLDTREYKAELEKKLFEEYNEVIEAEAEARLEELADMIEVIKSLAELEGSTIDNVLEIADKKAKKRGAFNNRIFLESVSNTEE